MANPEKTTISPHSLLVVQTAFYGDVILATPLVRAAAFLWPQAAIDFLCLPQTSSLLANHPLLRRTIAYDKRGRERGLRSLFRLARRLRGSGYDLALVPHPSLRSALLVWLARIPVRVGFDRNTGHKLFTHIVPYRREHHEVERNLGLLRPFGLEGGTWRPELFPSEDDREQVDALLAGLIGSAFAALAPGSVWPTKRWPAPYFAALAAELKRRWGLPGVIVGGSGDAALAAEVETLSDGAAYSLAGKLTPLQSAEVIRRAVLLVTNDTAPLHMASATQTPVVAIFGPTIPEFGFGPYRIPHRIAQLDLPCRPCSSHGGRRCPIGTFACMRELMPERVAGLVEDLLREGAASRMSRSIPLVAEPRLAPVPKVSHRSHPSDPVDP
ncbi:MAG: lipopolysaccharide heptosyltransferase II [candidate division KSB1 bacterium]|nr:lipopolysaccharide heptosyltransferase II [candidate division KSB1 bacterium]